MKLENRPTADKVTAFNVSALEKAVNDSAIRISAIWVTFVLFGLYLVVTAGNVTNRQLFLDETVKLPVLNIDLSLAGFFSLAPLLFVVFHAYVLLQVLLLARTTQAYNISIESNFSYPPHREVARQRLVNTLFAQMFGGSRREREGVIGALLRLIAWATLVVAPVVVLLTFQVKFLPYHSFSITFIHRILIVLDCGIALLLWPSVIDTTRDVSWREMTRRVLPLTMAFALIGLSSGVLTFSGEPHANWTRSSSSTQYRFGGSEECGQHFLAKVLPVNFDRLSLSGERFVDDDRIAKITNQIRSRELRSYDGESTRILRDRNLRCGIFSNTALQHADFTRADLSGANLGGAELQGAKLDGAHLLGTDLTRASLQGASLKGAYLQAARLVGTHLQGAFLDKARLQMAYLTGTELQGASLVGATLQGAILDKTSMQGASLTDAWLMGAKLKSANMQGAVMMGALFQAAELDDVRFWGTNLAWAQFQGAKLGDSQLALANLYGTEICGLDGSSSLPRTNAEGAYTDEVQRKPFIYVSRADQTGRAIPEERSRSELSERSLRGSVDDVNFFVERILEGTADGEREELRDNVREKLLQPWKSRDTASRCVPGELKNDPKKVAKYFEALSNYLLPLACQNGPNQDYVAEGIRTHWLHSGQQLSSNLTYLLANGFLRANCTTAANLTDAKRAELSSLLLGANQTAPGQSLSEHKAAQ